MLKFNVKGFAAAAVLALAALSNVSAQVESGSVLKFYVGSEFTVKGTMFPAGEYTVERTPATNDSPSLLILRGSQNSIVFDTVIADSRVAADRTELLFENVEGVNKLAAIVVEGHTTRNEIY